MASLRGYSRPIIDASGVIWLTLLSENETVLGAPPGRPLGTAFLLLRLGWDTTMPVLREQ
jgi:hypothetical protein